MEETDTHVFTPAQKRLLKLEERKKELEKKIREEQRLIKKTERHAHTLRLISMGLLVATEIKNGIRTEAEVKKALDAILTQDSHRASWDLPPLPKPNKPDTKKAPSEKSKPSLPIQKEEKVENVPTQKIKLNEVKNSSILNEFEV